ncbi:MerR family transcriptional regulator [Streptomyces sp. 769]|nr:MerR family transcriptional regulator [Streptomyces sp. 769]
MPLPGGGMGPRIADLHLLEAVLHGWDLATATGQDRTGDPDTVKAAYDRWYGNYPDEIRGQTGMFAPSKPAPDDAPVLDRLAAYFGRTV